MAKRVKCFSALSILFALNACIRTSDNANNINHESFSRIIYNEDSRKNIGFTPETYPPTLQSQATAMIFSSSETHREHYTLEKAQPLLCKDENFLKEPLIGFCSGVLIAPDKLLTAGHCFRSAKQCRESSFVFGFTHDESLNKPFSRQTIYSCKELLDHKNVRGRDKWGVDYAIVQLDREVQGVTPVKISSPEALPETGDAVISLSYPLGLPLKQDISKIIAADPKSNFLTADVDTFSASSGSPLFNKAGELIGILSYGSDDLNEDEVYEARREKGCYRFQRCNKSSPQASCAGENFFKAWLVPL